MTATAARLLTPSVLALEPWDGPGGSCSVYVHRHPDSGAVLYVGEAERAGSDRPEMARYADHRQRGTGGFRVCDRPVCYAVWRGSSALDMHSVEAALIAAHRPPCNARGVPRVGRRAVPADRPAGRRRVRRRPVRTARRAVRRARRTARLVRRCVRVAVRLAVLLFVLVLVLRVVMP